MENSKVIKISEDNYKWLARIAADLQKEHGQPASFDDALTTIKGKKERKGKLSDLAGSWNISDKEWSHISKDIKKGWKSWKIPSA